MDNIKLYEIDPAYVQFLSGYAAHLFHNKQPGQSNERKYIGVIPILQKSWKSHL